MHSISIFRAHSIERSSSVKRLCLFPAIYCVCCGCGCGDGVNHSTAATVECELCNIQQVASTNRPLFHFIHGYSSLSHFEHVPSKHTYFIKLLSECVRSVHMLHVSGSVISVLDSRIWRTIENNNNYRREVSSF